MKKRTGIRDGLKWIGLIGAGFLLTMCGGDDGDDQGALQAEAPAVSTVRCGTSWSQADETCGTTCTKNSDCPSGQTCYNSLKPDPCHSQTPDLTARCGTSWTDADDSCGTVCTKNSDCSSGQTCYNQLSTKACGVYSSERCGTSWSEADATCGQTCGTGHAACPSGQTCYNNLNKAPCVGWNYEDMLEKRCGKSWSDANSTCGYVCTKNSDCPQNNGAQDCYGGLDAMYCTAEMRCGGTWSDADSGCVLCRESSDCGSGETCYGGLTYASWESAGCN